MKTKVWKQTELKATPMTAAERQAKRKAKLVSDSQKYKELKELCIEYLEYNGEYAATLPKEEWINKIRSLVNHNQSGLNKTELSLTSSDKLTDLTA